MLLAPRRHPPIVKAATTGNGQTLGCPGVGYQARLIQRRVKKDETCNYSTIEVIRVDMKPSRFTGLSWENPLQYKTRHEEASAADEPWMTIRQIG